MTENAISASKAKNVKALKALLDVETLKASKNQAEDIKTAIEVKVKEEKHSEDSTEGTYEDEDEQEEEQFGQVFGA